MRAISVLSLDTGTSTRWCLAAAALRMRVKKSAMGSVCMFLLSLLPTRFHDSGNFAPERHATETNTAHFKLADVPAGAAADTTAVARAHLELGLLVSLGDFRGTCHLLCSPFFAERNAETLEQFASFVIVLRAGGQGDVHALDLVHARVIDFWKNQLVLQTQRVVAAPVEGIRGQAAKVAHAGQHHVAETVEKFVHLLAAQRNRAANGHALADFEVRDGLLCAGDHGFLAGDLAEFHRSGVQQLDVLTGFAETDVHGDLLQLRHRHDVLPAKALHQRGNRLFSVFVVQSTLHGLEESEVISTKFQVKAETRAYNQRLNPFFSKT